MAATASPYTLSYDFGRGLDRHEQRDKNASDLRPIWDMQQWFGGTKGVVMLRKFLLAAIAASYCFQSGSAQHETFGERVEHIVAYMIDKAEECIGPALEGEQPFKACRGDAGTISLVLAP